MSRIGSVIAVLLTLFIGCKMRNPREVASGESDPVYVMRQVVETYHSLSTYADQGTSIVRLTSVNYTVGFEMLFKRPARLRFEWTNERSEPPGLKQHGLIWSDGTNAWASYSFHGNKLEPKKDLDLAVAGATGASWGIAPTIPRLLTDDVSGFRLDEIQDLKIVGNDTADGVECVVLVGINRYRPKPTGPYASEEWKIWVGRLDHLIRRIEKRSDGSMQEEVRTQIVVNQEIPDSRFSERGY
jgi:outer membrane lipoprotein-sorting protein